MGTPGPGSTAEAGSGLIGAGTSAQLPDLDPAETADWLESLDELVERDPAGAPYLLRRLVDRARQHGVDLPPLAGTDYVNSIGSGDEPPYPGDEGLEQQLGNAIRWNAAAIVARANRPELALGGHLASYASIAELLEVAFNHFLRGKDPTRDGAGSGTVPGDQVFIQGHSSPGVYARAFLERRLSAQQLDLFRQETVPGGLSSYPHPRLMPAFWEFPTVSMGLSAIGAIYQARFNRYLHAAGIADTSASRVWAFLGDGEMDEPEAQGALTVAAREDLDNLVFVVNCNLQRLDGPVRGNGHIIQELEALFLGAGWNVYKVVWGRRWDPLLAADHDGDLVRWLNAVPDGQFQTFATESAAYIRSKLVPYPAVDRLLGALPDPELTALLLDRGGHDLRKIFAAYDAATRPSGRPTVVLAQTVKGRGLGQAFEARNATHQLKKFPRGTLNTLRDRLGLPIPDAELAEGVAPYHLPPDGSPLDRYLRDRRAALGGPLPRRVVRPHPLPLPAEEVHARLRAGSGSQQVATTMALVRLVKDLLRVPELGGRIVPIIPDEARTFGLDSMFPTLRIYAPHGQRYDAVDRDMVLSYQESEHGRILHEGITEAGSMATFAAAGSSHATFGEPMIPLYIFYSMFGFQRTGDLAWSAADQRARGFLIGATAGRTTLNGEGLQHQDGHSLLLASTNPACVSYDPSFAYELGSIVGDGLRRMYGEHAEDVFYYLTVYNEPVLQPPWPDGLTDADVVAGLYRYAPAPDRAGLPAQLLASGSAMPAAIAAQRLLADQWDVAAAVWSAPGWQQLRREAVDCESWNRLNPTAQPRQPLVTRLLEPSQGPIVAVTDFMRAVPDQIARWIPAGRGFAVLGTDGFGRSDTRPALRRWFNIDAESIVVAALAELAVAGEIKRERVAEAIERYGIDPDHTTRVP